MKQLTINLSFYNQNEILKKHVMEWKSFPVSVKDSLKFSIIDDHSKVPAEEVLKDMDVSDLDISIYRVEDDLYCNIAGARNLGAKECRTEWMLILDMDTLVSSEAAVEMLKKAEDSGPGVAYKFNRRVEDTGHEKHHVVHPAVCLIRKEDYWRAGGCDEDFVGNYGFTDPSFWHKSQGLIRVEECREIYLDYIPEGQADINRDRKKNSKLFKSKKKSGAWSTDYIRFKWRKIK